MNLLIKTRGRILWADYAKVLTIFLVVLEHSEFNIALFRLFRMPLFFLVSGYFVNPSKYSFEEFLLRNLRYLIIPYLTFGILNIPFSWTSIYLHPELYPFVENWGDYLIHPILGMCIGDDRVTSFSYLPCGPLWFLIALFFMKLIFYVLYHLECRIKRKNVYWTCVLFFVPILFLLMRKYLDFMSLDSTLLAIPFFILGYLMKKNSFPPIVWKSKMHTLLMIFLMFAYLFFLGVNNGYVDVNGGLYGNNLILFYVNGFIGSYMTLMICTLFPGMNDFIYFIGKNTAIILGVHLITIRISKFFLVYTLNIPSETFINAHYFIIGCMAFVFCYPFIVWINRYAPWMVGK